MAISERRRGQALFIAAPPRVAASTLPSCGAPEIAAKKMKFVVDIGQSRKETVDVTPNTTFGFVLEEVCKRRKLNVSEHDLKHKQKHLDRSLTVRFAGISANAMLELVAAQQAAHGECTVALQGLEGGGRPTAKLHNSTTLAAMLSQLAPGVAAPCVVYVGRSISGDALATTTLLDFGIGRGSQALLRVSQDTTSTSSAAATSAAATTAAPGAIAAAEPVPVPAGAMEVDDDIVVVPSAAEAVAAETAAFESAFESPSAAVSAAASASSSPGPSVVAGTEVASTAVASTAVASALGAGGAGAAAAHEEAEVIEDSPEHEMMAEAIAMLSDACDSAAAAAGADGGGGGGAAAFAEALSLLARYMRNICTAPSDMKFRSIRKNNARFHAALGRHAGHSPLLPVHAPILLPPSSRPSSFSPPSFYSPHRTVTPHV